MSIKKMPSSERPYEKMLLYGAEALSNSELLAIIIKTGTKEKNSIELAHQILSMEKGGDNLRFMQNTSVEEFMQIKGIGRVKAIQLKAICELTKRMSKPIMQEKIKIKTPRDVVNLLMDELKFEKREKIKELILNTKNILIKVIDISYGGTDYAIVEPKDILGEALKSNEPKIILVHNHPSGDPKPSKQDIAITKRILEASKLLGIELVDHIVIGDDKYESIMPYLNWGEERNRMSLFSFKSKDIGIDLGTSNILITVRGKGIVLSEPSVVAMERKSENILATGIEAKEMLGRTPEQIIAVRPMKDGVIADFTATQLMIKNLIAKICKRYNISKPRVIVGVPSGITEVEERAVEEAVSQTGAREVYLIEEPMAAAIGAGLDVVEPTGNMIIDIGGGTTEIAVISLGGIVISNSIKVAGDELDEAIVNYIKNNLNLAIGQNAAEEAKKELGCAIPQPEEKSMEVRGRDLTTGLPENRTITSKDIQLAIAPEIEKIIDLVRTTLEKTPPELASDIVDKGITLAGGGALIKGIDTLISQKTEIPVYIAERPLECVANGTGTIIEDMEKLRTALINRRRK